MTFLGLHIVDAYILFILILEASMIFPALNWWPHPIKSFRNLAPPDKFTFAVATFTGLLFFATCMQVWAFIQSERAFLSIDAIQPINNTPFVAGSIVSVSGRIRNSGRTTAFITSMNLTTALLDTPLPAFPAYREGSQDVLGPVVAGGVTIGNFPAMVNGHTAILSQFHADAIQRNTFRMYVYGYIEYRDEYSVFGNRITGFCYIYNPRGNESTSFFDNCTNGNYVYARSCWGEASARCGGCC